MVEGMGLRARLMVMWAVEMNKEGTATMSGWRREREVTCDTHERNDAINI